ncbi:MAG: hypothetical protein R3266_11115, partial [Gemmatimonadota bacterium]|nr:hypothetical protein [Gemmatimonadota bacterium]
ADGMIPSAGRALGVEPELTAGAWTDTPRDREWMAPGDASLYASIDGFHAPPASVRGDSTWAEWHYFNILLPDGWLYLTYMIAGDVPEGRWGGRMLGTRVLGDGELVYEATYEPGDVDFAPGRADLRIGPSSVRIDPDGVYRVQAEIPPADGGADGARALVVDLAIAAPVRKYLPPVDLGGSDFASGYVVPLLDARASGRVCRGTGCRTIEGARAYHDHNWGVWRDVTWEWGQANFASGLSLLYGVVIRDAVPAGSGFAYLFDDEGFAAVLPLDSVEWRWSDAGRGPRPERMALLATRGRDTLRLTVEVEHARATVVGDGPGDARSVFHQLRGSARATVSLEGTRRAAEGEGFFETWSARPPE